MLIIMFAYITPSLIPGTSTAAITITLDSSIFPQLIMIGLAKDSFMILIGVLVKIDSIHLK